MVVHAGSPPYGLGESLAASAGEGESVRRYYESSAELWISAGAWERST
jgi:hypothetical protein